MQTQPLRSEPTRSCLFCSPCCCSAVWWPPSRCSRFPRRGRRESVMLAIGVPAVVLLVGFGFYLRAVYDVRGNGVRQLRCVCPTAICQRPAQSSRNAGETRSRLGEPQIPVDAAEKADAKSTKPAAKPASGTVAATSSRAGQAKTAADEAAPATSPAAAPAKKPPAWVDQPPRLLGDTYQMTIVVGPYTTRAGMRRRTARRTAKGVEPLRRNVHGPAGRRAARRVALRVPPPRSRQGANGRKSGRPRSAR